MSILSMVDQTLYAIARILSAITTTVLSRVHAIINPQDVSQDLLSQCQTAQRPAERWQCS
jgi:hypothetical protein